MVMSLFRKGVHKLSLGRHHTAAVTEDGDAFTTFILDHPRLVADRCKFHRLKPPLHVKDIVASPVDHTLAIDLEGKLYTWEPNTLEDPKTDETLETRHLHEIAAGLEHVAVIGNINRAWRTQAAEQHEKAIQ